MTQPNRPIYFTVTGDFRAIVGFGQTRLAYDPEVVPISGTVTFTPMLRGGDIIRATTAVPRPIGYVPATVEALIDPADGRVKMLESVDDDADPVLVPVRLLADSPLLELKTPLFYSVSFRNIRFGRRPASITGFTFQAANAADVEINLITVMRQPGQPASGITKIAPGAVRIEDDKLVFSFSGVDIPDPVSLAGLGLGTGGGGGGVGPPGPPGQDGKNGSEWYFGDGPPGTLIGSKPGDVYLDNLTGKIYKLGG
jgi:hypothetical protein